MSTSLVSNELFLAYKLRSAAVDVDFYTQILKIDAFLFEKEVLIADASLGMRPRRRFATRVSSLKKEEEKHSLSRNSLSRNCLFLSLNTFSTGSRHELALRREKENTGIFQKTRKTRETTMADVGGSTAFAVPLSPTGTLDAGALARAGAAAAIHPTAVRPVEHGRLVLLTREGGEASTYVMTKEVVVLGR